MTNLNVVETSIAESAPLWQMVASPQLSCWTPIWSGSAATTPPEARRELNAYVVMNPSAHREAEASDARRARGETLGALDGIPYSAKDSYLARGLTAAAGSPAFVNLVAQKDAFAIERLRAAGAVLIGLTNMPPMANGGMQRGVYGRAESPYNADWLTSAFGSGSSNGSGTAVGASLCAFGLGEETWSSGRAPASNNGLCAYTPSRGLISVRGNWALVPTMDVVVPPPAPWMTCSASSTRSSPTTPSPEATSGAASHGSRFPAPQGTAPRPIPRYALITQLKPRQCSPGSASECHACTSTPTTKRAPEPRWDRRSNRAEDRDTRVSHGALGICWS